MYIFGAVFIRGRRLISKRDLVNCSCSAAIDKQRIDKEFKQKA